MTQEKDNDMVEQLIEGLHALRALAWCAFVMSQRESVRATIGGFDAAARRYTDLHEERRVDGWGDGLSAADMAALSALRVALESAPESPDEWAQMGSLARRCLAPWPPPGDLPPAEPAEHA